MSDGLVPLTPEVKAKRKRQNRIVVALVLLVVVPVLTVIGSQRYVDYEMKQWSHGPTFVFEEPTTIFLGIPGEYIIWSPAKDSECTLTQDGNLIEILPVEGTYSGGLYNAGSFVTHSSGNYEILCFSTDEEADNHYGMVSKDSPVGSLTVLLITCYLIAFASAVTGLVLLIIGIVANINEKKPRVLPSHIRIPPPATPQYSAQQPSVPPQYPAQQPSVPPQYPTQSVPQYPTQEPPVPPQYPTQPPSVPQVPIQSHPVQYPSHLPIQPPPSGWPPVQ